MSKYKKKIMKNTNVHRFLEEDKQNIVTCHQLRADQIKLGKKLIGETVTNEKLFYHSIADFLFDSLRVS